MLKRPQNIISGFAATEKIQSMAKVRKVFRMDTGGTAFPSLSNLLPPLILLKQGSQNFFSLAYESELPTVSFVALLPLYV